MKKPLLFLLLLSVFSTSNAQTLWHKVTEAEASRNEKRARTSFPVKQEYYHLELETLKSELANAPMRGQTSSLVIPFPDSDGNLQHFRIWEAPVMHRELAAKFPDNKSYIGKGVENPSSIIRFSVTLFGLHAMTLAANDGTWYIDPYTTNSQYYIAYSQQGLTTSRSFQCLTSDTEPALRMSDISAQPEDNGSYRTYRTGIVCTVEFSAFHIAEAGLQAGTLAQKKAAVLAAVAITLTRVNSMFERDLSVFLELIPNEDAIIYIDTDNLTNDDVGALIGETQETMDEVIGPENYDFGHGVGTSGGGLGGGTPCIDGQKAFGATGLGSPVGDPFDIDYVAHEMGHQFGAAHTFNNECGGNRDNNWSYEPGSGSSIMAYAGICDPNIQSNSNAQFFAGSIAQIRNTINGSGGSCITPTSNNNTRPTADAGKDYAIPLGTAFILTGSATDADGDTFTYMWEQYDKEISQQPPVATATNGPNFKPQVISTTPQRYLPQLSDVFANNLTPTWEVISNVGRNYNFAFTVRDNNITGGESRTDFMKATVSGTAGPFVVTSPNTNVNWAVASNQTVTWNVAGTTGNGVNTPSVDILLSTNGTLTNTILLAENVPNDGSETITVPNTQGNTNRIVVRGHNNIFYDVSNQNFMISAPAATFLFENAGTQNSSACQGADVTYTFDYENLAGFSGTTTFSASGAPANAVVNFTPSVTNSNGLVTLVLTNTQNSPTGFYAILVTGISGSITKTATVYLDLLSLAFANTILITPSNMAVGVAMSSTFAWEAGSNATAYDIEIATDSAFSNIVVSATSATNSYVASGLAEATTYYWRVKPRNAACSGEFSAISQFATGQMVCEDYAASDVPIAISDEDVATVTSILNITDVFTIQDATLTLDISHTWVNDIAVKLISPAGTEINLFSHKCDSADNVSATFDDDGSTLNCSGTPVISGMIAPETALNTLIGETSNGVWKLEVFDEFAEDGGSINSWSLNLCSVQPALSVINPIESLDFALYPNPSSGSFTIQANNVQDSHYEINVYDMRGRKIFGRKAISNGGQLLETVSLNAETGVYMMELRSDDMKNVKKFIIK